MNDPKKPLTNPAMKKAMADMKANNTPETRNLMINMMMRSTFLVPVQVGFAGPPPKMDKNGKLAIVMGSEGAGMRRLVEENCDLTVRLPISDKVESLNVSTAAAIVLYELSKI